MKKTVVLTALIGLFTACSQSNEEILENQILILKSEQPYELGEPFSFVNEHGEVVVPENKYAISFTNEITSYGCVSDKNGKIFAINTAGEELYEVYNYDNGPDYIKENRFRVVVDGKIGYADGKTGELVIQPQYKCAFPFENGKAKVAKNCENQIEGEYTEWTSDTWILIDANGKKVAQ